MNGSDETVDAHLRSIYTLVDPPWAVAIAGFVAKSYYSEGNVPFELESKFDALNGMMIHWWPALQPPLGTIYSTYYVQCLDVLEGINPANEHLVKLGNTLLKSVLLQMRVLSYIEIELNEPRPGIGSEVFEMTEQSFECLVRNYLANVSNEKVTFLELWIKAFSGGQMLDWKAGLSGLFTPLGGPPAKPAM